MPEGQSGSRKDFLRHPMAIVLVSFLLSGLIGAGFSNWLSGQTKEAERARIQAESRKAAVQNLSRYVYERRARAEMLASAFRRHAPVDEIKDRKKLYDDAYVKWNSNHQANLFLIRDVLQDDDYSYVESVVEFRLVGKIFGPLDGCLTKAYDSALSSGDPVGILNDCDARRLLQEALDCGYAVTNELYKLSGGVTIRSEAATEIDRRCPD